MSDLFLGVVYISFSKHFFFAVGFGFSTEDSELSWSPRNIEKSFGIQYIEVFPKRD